MTKKLLITISSTLLLGGFSLISFSYFANAESWCEGEGGQCDGTLKWQSLVEKCEPHKTCYHLPGESRHCNYVTLCSWKWHTFSRGCGGRIYVCDELDGHSASCNGCDGRCLYQPSVIKINNTDYEPNPVPTYSLPIKIAWTGDPEAHHYLLNATKKSQTGDNNSNFKIVVERMSVSPTASHGDCKQGNSYQYIITAINKFGESSGYDPSTGIKAYAPSQDGSIKITWEEVTNAESYKIYRKDISGDYYFISSRSKGKESEGVVDSCSITVPKETPSQINQTSLWTNPVPSITDTGIPGSCTAGTFRYIVSAVDISPRLEKNPDGSVKTDPVVIEEDINGNLILDVVRRANSSGTEKITTTANNNIKISWPKVPGADIYKIYKTDDIDWKNATTNKNIFLVNTIDETGLDSYEITDACQTTTSENPSAELPGAPIAFIASSDITPSVYYELSSSAVSNGSHKYLIAAKGTDGVYKKVEESQSYVTYSEGAKVSWTSLFGVKSYKVYRQKNGESNWYLIGEKGTGATINFEIKGTSLIDSFQTTKEKKEEPLNANFTIRYPFYNTETAETQWIPEACFLDPNTEYEVGISSCCSNGSCGLPTMVRFTTGSGIELVSPAPAGTDGWASGGIWEDRSNPKDGIKEHYTDGGREALKYYEWNDWTNWPAEMKTNHPQGSDPKNAPLIRFKWCEAGPDINSYFLKMEKEKSGTPPWEGHLSVVITKNKAGTLPNSFDRAGKNEFTIDTKYQWKVAGCEEPDGTKCATVCTGCKDITKTPPVSYTSCAIAGTTPTKYLSGNACAEYSNPWEFIGTGKLAPPGLISPVYTSSPETIPYVNMDDLLKWNPVTGAYSYNIIILDKSDPSDIKYKTLDALKPEGSLAPLTNVPLNYNGTPTSGGADYVKTFLWENLDNNKYGKIYTWKVRTCREMKGLIASITDALNWALSFFGLEIQGKCYNWSDEWKFKTTGEPPTNLSADAAVIPVKLSWTPAPGATSYRVFVSQGATENEGKLVSSNSLLIDYPKLLQNITYEWKVKTCADKDGTFCGPTTAEQSFTTFTLVAPTTPIPASSATISTDGSISWDDVPGAKGYKYEISYSGSGDTSANCASAGKVLDGVTTSNSLALSAMLQGKNKLCVGGYSWTVQSCLTTNCESKNANLASQLGGTSLTWTFNLAQSLPSSQQAGLIPCGQKNNLSDPYGIDERETCQFKHFFVMIRTIIDFLLWKLGIIALVLLIVYTGVLFLLPFYFKELTATTGTVKQIWKATGAGYLVMLFAWTIINTILSLLGYSFGVPWWNFRF